MRNLLKATGVVSLLLVLGSLAYPVYPASAEETQVQVVRKVDPVTKDEIEFRLKLYTLQTLHELIPSIGEQKEPAAASYKYIFCTVRNLSSRNAIKIVFVFTSANAPQIRSFAPQITLPWMAASAVGAGSEQHVVIPIGNPYLGIPGIPDREVKLDVEITKLQRK